MSLRKRSSESSPSTPRKKRVVSMPMSPLSPSNSFKIQKALVNDTKLPLSPPVTPTKQRIIDLTASTVNSPSHIYTQAKGLFQRGSTEDASGFLTGREQEAEILNKFLISSIKDNLCSSIYVSGPPGTGKTAQVSVSFKHLQKLHGKKFVTVKINCMTLSKPENVFHEIYCSITKTRSISYGKKKTFDDLYNLLVLKCEYQSVVVLLDEMDCLITKDQEILFQLFSTASSFKASSLSTKLVLVGISNALDLTDKFLPRLRSNGLNPKALQFLPYSADQIRDVIISKLRSLLLEDKENLPPNFIPIMHPVAILLCCKKAASITGDLRKAFDICYKSIEIVEESTRKDGTIADLDAFTAPKVQLPHIAKVCSSSFGVDSMTKLNNLNLLQKAVLCCLFSYQVYVAKTGLQVTVNSFYDFYLKYTMKTIDNLLGKLKKEEFLEIISALEASSVITISSSYNAGVDVVNKLIRANVPYEELLRGIGQVGVLKKILTELYN